MDVLSWRLRSHQLWFEGNSVMLGAPWGSKGRSAVAAPWLPPAIWQKTLNKVSNPSTSQKETKYAPSIVKHLLGCAQHASKLCVYTQKSRYIAATAFSIL